MTLHDADKPDADTPASEDGAEAKEGGDWGAEAAEGEGENPKQWEEEDDESEEAREARLAEYAAAKAEEDAIKQVKYGGFRIRAW